MAPTDDLSHIRGILKSARVAVVTTRSDDNHLYSRPLALVDDEFDGTVWFLTEDPSAKTAEVRYEPEVNVSVADKHGYLSLSGVATVERDRERIRRFWNPWAEAWFDGGPDDERVALLRVSVSSAEYWSIDKSLPARVFEIAKALITKTQPDVGENRTVDVVDPTGQRGA
jgi:general stress protein 26